MEFLLILVEGIAQVYFTKNCGNTKPVFLSSTDTKTAILHWNMQFYLKTNILTSKFFIYFSHIKHNNNNILVSRCLSQGIAQPRINGGTGHTRLHVSNFSFTVIQHAGPGTARRIPLSYRRFINRGINRILPPLNHLLNRN